MIAAYSIVLCGSPVYVVAVAVAGVQFHGHRHFDHTIYKAMGCARRFMVSSFPKGKFPKGLFSENSKGSLDEKV